jgi:hypothetical protein
MIAVGVPDEWLRRPRREPLVACFDEIVAERYASTTRRAARPIPLALGQDGSPPDH